MTSDDRERQLIECLRLFDEAGGFQGAEPVSPGLESDIEALGQTIHLLQEARPGDAPVLSQTSSRRQLLTSLEQPARKGLLRLIPLNRTAAGALAMVLVLASAAGAGAANLGGMSELGPVSEVLSAVGLVKDTDDNDAEEPESAFPTTEDAGGAGAGVNQDVGIAIDDTEPGPERGIAVSEAACEAAHDAERLPDAAKDKPERATKDCEHPNADGTPGANSAPGGNGASDPGANAGGSKPDAPPGKPAELPSSAPPDPSGKPEETPGGGSNGGGSQQGGPPGQNKKP